MNNSLYAQSCIKVRMIDEVVEMLMREPHIACLEQSCCCPSLRYSLGVRPRQGRGYIPSLGIVSVGGPPNSVHNCIVELTVHTTDSTLEWRAILIVSGSIVFAEG